MDSWFGARKPLTKMMHGRRASLFEQRSIGFSTDIIFCRRTFLWIPGMARANR
jgi:hypothetical protein